MGKFISGACARRFDAPVGGVRPSAAAVALLSSTLYGRAARGRRIVARWRSAAPARRACSRPSGQRLLLDGDGEVVPAGHAGVGPVEHAVARRDAPTRAQIAARQRSRPGRRADLVGDHAARSPRSRISRSIVCTKLRPCARIDPGGADDSDAAPSTLRAPPASPASLVRAVDAERAGASSGRIGPSTLRRRTRSRSRRGSAARRRALPRRASVRDRRGVDRLAPAPRRFLGAIDGGVGGAR